MNKKGMARRNFLRYGSVVTAGALVSAPLMASANNADDIKGKTKFIYRKLGNTGIELPIVSFGVMRSDNPQVVEAAYKSGIKHFDTAAVYQDGNNELMLGKLFKKYPRESFTIATKMNPGRVGTYDKDKGELTEGFAESFYKQFAESLERLQMDYVDILYIHAIEHASVAFDQRVMDCLIKVKEEGKARFVGISTHQPKEILEAALEKGFYDVLLIPINYKQAEDLEYFDLIKKASEKGFGIVAMKTMMGGYLDKERSKKVNGVAALKWVMQKSYIHTAIPAVKNFEELNQNISIMSNLEINRKEWEDLELAYKETGLFCTNCGECLLQCKNNLAIPGLMRAYMYAYGYGETKKALGYLDTLPEINCKDCIDCNISCSAGFKIKEKIADIVRLREVPEDFLI